MVIAEIKRALLLIDHHLRWLEKDRDLATVQEVNALLQRTAVHAENVYKQCRITLCQTCDEILKLRPEMDRQIVHDWHKKERVRYEYHRTTKIIVANVK